VSGTLELRLAAAASVFAGGERAGEVAFARTELRRRRYKFRADCGHLVDGSRRPDALCTYRYQVWKIVGSRGLEQRTDCEECARFQ